MNQTFYKHNRERLYQVLDDFSMTILFSGKIFQKSADQDFPFEVNKNFYYLTGINQANVTFAAIKSNQTIKEYVFIDEHNETESKWLGKKLSVEEAKMMSGIEFALFQKDFPSFIHRSLNSIRHVSLQVKSVYLDLERREQQDHTTSALTFSQKDLKKYPDIAIKNIYEQIVTLRMVKSADEIALIKESIATTKEALDVMLKQIKAGLYEYQLESYFDQHIYYHGQKSRAFETIAATGKNATILHYVSNNTMLEDGDLILFDLGCRTHFYVSDITRTYPVNKKFSTRQKTLYDIVLETNKACIAYVKPGITWEQLNNHANQLLITGLKKCKLIQNDDDFRKFYWHSIGHSIGLDTHDPAISAIPFVEGMVITIEPGLYMEEEDIGIRIEDNVLITNEGAVNLSCDIIKEIKDIEKAMSE